MHPTLLTQVPRKGFETALPELLRNKLSYPLQVSKSTFQTLGTKHSWPHVLGVLHYLCGRASRCLRRSADPQGEGAGEIVDIVFPCTDEHGFSTDSATSDDNIFFQTWKACYAAFDRGHDEHSNELEVLQVGGRRGGISSASLEICTCSKKNFFE